MKLVKINDAVRARPRGSEHDVNGSLLWSGG